MNIEGLRAQDSGLRGQDTGVRGQDTGVRISVSDVSNHLF